jgi:hypothetical protein
MLRRKILSTSTATKTNSSSSLVLLSTRRSVHVNIHAITDINFKRPPPPSPLAISTQSTTSTILPPSASSLLSPTEHAYSRFADEHGLCNLKDFYRGVGQAYYALATALGGSRTRGSSVVLSPVVNLRLKMTQNPSTSPTILSTSSSSEQQQQQKNSEKKQQEESSPYSPKNILNYRNDKSILSRISKTRKEDILFDHENYKKKVESGEDKSFLSVEWPPVKEFDAEFARQLKFVESLLNYADSATTESSKSKGEDNNNKKKDNNESDANSITNNIALDIENYYRSESGGDGNKNSTAFVVSLVRSLLSPSFRASLYKFSPWNTKFMNTFASVSTSGNPLATPSPDTAARLYQMIAHDDEKIEAVQIESFELIPKGADKNSNKEEKDEGETKTASSEDDTNNNSTGSYTPKQDFDDFPPAGASGTTSISLAEYVRQERMKDVTQRYDILVSVNLLVQIPPARYCYNYEYFRSRMRTDGEGLEDHFGGNLEAVQAAAISTARILAISNVFNTFRALEWIGNKIFKTPARLDPRAMPHHILGLSEAFPTQPCRYVKTMKLVYNPELEHWRINKMQLSGHYLKDFDAEDWKASGGGSIY